MFNMGGGEQSANSGTVDGCSSGSQINNSEETFLQQNCETNKPGSNQKRQSFSTGLNIGTEHRPVQGCWADAVWRTDWHKRTHTHILHTNTHQLYTDSFTFPFNEGCESPSSSLCQIWTVSLHLFCLLFPLFFPRHRFKIERKNANVYWLIEDRPVYIQDHVWLEDIITFFFNLLFL